MKEYKKLANKPTFSLKDVVALTGNESTATSLISRWLKKKYFVRIRKGLYTCVDLTTGDIVANKYQIASAINEESYVSHHTALEFYGLVNQVYNVVYVSSKYRFNNFSFMGISYKYVKSAFDDGIMNVKNIEGIKITDKERSYIDSANLLSKIGGVEEFIYNTKMIEELDEEKLLNYLDKYNKKVLYQKVGFFLKNYYTGENLSCDFFDLCQLRSAHSVRYLIQGREGKLDNEWNLVVPEEFTPKKNEREEPDEYI